MSGHEPRLLSRGQLVRSALGAGVAFGASVLGGYRLLGRSSAASSGAPGPPGPRTHRFVSRPDLRPPVLTVLGTSGSSDLFFLTPLSGPGQRGALIVDAAGETVWFKPAPIDAANLNVALYRGQPVLTWWEGKEVPGGVGEGSYFVADQRYRTVAHFAAGLGYQSDLHEYLLTPRGSALVTVQRTASADMRPVGGPRRGAVIDMGFQELDVATGEVLLHWSGLDHVALTESYKPIGGPGPYDFLHLNSIDPGPDGTILLGARHTWALYGVEPASGAILWRLGGKRSDFVLPPRAAFAWQHDARWQGASTITLFDDGAGPSSEVERQSRGLVLELDTAARRVRFGRAYTHAPPLLAAAMGSFQPRADGGAVVGWGTASYVTAYGADGAVEFDARLPHGIASYRSPSYPWVGRPLEPPALAAEPGTGALYVSWNGATEVASWELRTGASAGALAPARTVPRGGFETSLGSPGAARYAAAVALDRSGAPLGSSATIAL